jgi:hypothetical protein
MVLASSLADRVLVEEEIDEDSDAATLSEVVDRVKTAYKAEADAELLKTKVVAEKSEAELVRFRMHIERRARSVAQGASWTLAAILGASLVAATTLSIVDAVRGSSPGLAALALAIGPLAVVGLLGVLWGFHVKAWRRRLEDRFAGWLKRWMSGSS